VSLEWVLFGLRLLAIVILYFFLVVAFYLLWQDLKKANNQHAVAQPQAMHQLRVVAISSNNNSLCIGETLPLQSVNLLGRAPESTIVLNDDSIAAQHARLSRRDGVWWLEDMGSHTGTLLNNLPLSSPATLSEGDVIGVGGLSFRLETVSPGQK
jgi:hypothetical protein